MEILIVPIIAYGLTSFLGAADGLRTSDSLVTLLLRIEVVSVQSWRDTCSDFAAAPGHLRGEAE
jgi:hypothetical protein